MSHTAIGAVIPGWPRAPHLQTLSMLGCKKRLVKRTWCQIHFILIKDNLRSKDPTLSLNVQIPPQPPCPTTLLTLLRAPPKAFRPGGDVAAQGTQDFCGRDSLLGVIPSCLDQFLFYFHVFLSLCLLFPSLILILLGSVSLFLSLFFSHVSSSFYSLSVSPLTSCIF